MLFVWLSGTKGGKYPHDSTIKARTFVVRDFVIGTSSALVATVKVEGTDVKVRLLHQERFHSQFWRTISGSCDPLHPLQWLMCAGNNFGCANTSHAYSIFNFRGKCVALWQSGLSIRLTIMKSWVCLPPSWGAAM